MEGNGDKAPAIEMLPKIELTWDSQSQSVDITFKADQFKNWDFVLGLLDMARLKAEHMRHLAIMAAMQQQAMRAQVDHHSAQQAAQQIKRRILPH